MQRFSRVLFLALALAIITGLLYIQDQQDQQRQRFEHLTEKIDRLQEMIDNQEETHRSTLEELTEAYDENDKLVQKLDKAQKNIDGLKQRNAELESILFNQRETYRQAVAMRGAGMSVLTHSDFTARQYERAWSCLGAGGLKGTGEALVRAEENHGVNSLVLSAIAFLESGGGNSRLAREKNNLFGLGAGGSDPYSNALHFSSRGECIDYTARIIRYRYLSRGAQLHRGDNLVAIGPNYAADPLWADKVSRHMSLIARAAIPGGR